MDCRSLLLGRISFVNEAFLYDIDVRKEESDKATEPTAEVAEEPIAEVAEEPIAEKAEEPIAEKAEEPIAKDILPTPPSKDKVIKIANEGSPMVLNISVSNCTVNFHFSGTPTQQTIDVESTEPSVDESITEEPPQSDTKHVMFDTVDRVATEGASSPIQTPKKHMYPKLDKEHPVSDIIRLENYDEKPSIELLGEFRWKMKLVLMDKICSAEIETKTKQERVKSDKKNKKILAAGGDPDESMDAELETEADIQNFIYEQALLYIGKVDQDRGIQGLGGRGANIARKGALGDQYFTNPAMYELLYGLIDSRNHIRAIFW